MIVRLHGLRAKNLRCVERLRIQRLGHIIERLDSMRVDRFAHFQSLGHIERLLSIERLNSVRVEGFAYFQRLGHIERLGNIERLNGLEVLGLHEAGGQDSLRHPPMVQQRIMTT